MHALSRCFRKCSIRAEHATAQRDMNKALTMLNEQIADCCERERQCEQVLMQAQHALRCMAANLANDPYPEVLMHRLKAQVMEKNAAQYNLDRTSAMIRQLKTQKRVLEESDLSSEVVYTLQQVMRRMQPHVKQTSAMTDKVVDMVLEQREEARDVAETLANDMDDAFDTDTYDDDMQMLQKDLNTNYTLPSVNNEQAVQESLDTQTQEETELLMQAIRAQQREQLQGVVLM